MLLNEELQSSECRIHVRQRADEREEKLKNGGIDASRQNAWHVTQEKLPEFGLRVERFCEVLIIRCCVSPFLSLSSYYTKLPTMAKGENSKKAAGNAKKAEVAAQKQAVENQKKAKAEDQEWSKGAKDSSKA